MKRNRQEYLQNWQIQTAQPEYSYTRYDLYSNWTTVSSKETKIEYDKNETNPLTTEINITYECLNFNGISKRRFITETSSTNSMGDVIISKYRYPLSYSATTGIFKDMKDAHIISPIIEKNTYYQKNNKLINSVLTFYGKNPVWGIKPSTIWTNYNKLIYINLNGYIANDGSFSNTSNFYRVSNASLYDVHGNLMEYNKENDIFYTVLYGNNSTLPVAFLKNARHSEIYFNNFEDCTNCTTTEAYSGTKSVKAGEYEGSFNIPFTDLNHIRYTYSAWFKTDNEDLKIVIKDNDQNPWLSKKVPNTNNKWQYVEYEVDISSSQFVGSSTLYCEIWNPLGKDAYIDDVKFAPSESEFTTINYKSPSEISSIIDLNNSKTLFKFDGFKRLTETFDLNDTLLQKIEYHIINN